mmetsp:Transcript_79443/g.199652  ORF Transcript_79443/g.199652 Transcript_79443/m.199652 type:complete len:105 (+) Transcript_79443:374-688(+)
MRVAPLRHWLSWTKSLQQTNLRLPAPWIRSKRSKKTAYNEENLGTLAWLSNFLDRSGSLRAQLQALTGFQDSDIVKQMVKAASVAFGGGRKGDYPKVGASSYSS